MPNTGIRSIARNTALLTAAQAIGTIARLVYVVLAARLLGPELYALLAYSQSWYQAFLPIAIFGLGSALVYAIGRDRANAQAIAAQAMSIRLVATLVAVAACAILGWLITPDPRSTQLILVLALALAGRAVVAWAQHLFTAFEITGHTLRQEVAFRVLEVAAAIAALLTGGGLLALVVIHSVVAWAQAAWALRVVRREILRPAIAWRPSAWRPMVALALPFFLIALTVDWRTYGSLIMFRNLNGDAVLFSQFALAMQAFVIASLVPTSLVTAAQPVLMRSAIRGDGKDLVFAAIIQRYAFVVGAAAGLAGLAAGPPLFRIVFGAAYETAGHLVGLTLWCLLPLTAGIGFPSVLIARGRLRAVAAISIAGATVMTLLLPVLVPALGAPGAILAAGAGYATPPLVAMAIAARNGWADWTSLVIRPALAVVAALAIYVSLAPLSVWLALAVALPGLGSVAAMLGVVRRADRELLRGLM